jgi:hypothetical protein
LSVLSDSSLRNSSHCFLDAGFQWGIWSLLQRDPHTEGPPSSHSNLASHFPGHLASTPSMKLLPEEEGPLRLSPGELETRGHSRGPAMSPESCALRR